MYAHIIAIKSQKKGTPLFFNHSGYTTCFSTREGFPAGGVEVGVSEAGEQGEGGGVNKTSDVLDETDDIKTKCAFERSQQQKEVLRRTRLRKLSWHTKQARQDERIAEHTP